MIDNINGDEYIIACLVCGKRNNLQMFAHRNKDKILVGWIFACSNCQAEIIDAELILKQSHPQEGERK